MPKTPDYHPQYVVQKIVTCQEVVFPLRHTALWLARRLQIALFSGFWSQGEIPVLDENMSGSCWVKKSPNQVCYFRSRASCHKKTEIIDLNFMLMVSVYYGYLQVAITYVAMNLN